MKKSISLLTLALCFSIFGSYTANAQQLIPHRADVNQPVIATFKAPTVVLLPSVKNLYAKTLNMSIYHTFGLVNTGVKQFWGLDGGTNIRLGLDYGITNDLSVGLGRTSLNKNVDARFKYSILHQMTENGSPVDLAVTGDLGVITEPQAFQGSYTFGDKLGYSLMFMAARKFSDNLSLQVSPVVGHFNKVFSGEKNTYFGVGFSGRYKLTGHTALAIEYLPVFNKTNSMTNELSVAVNIETGGHVFQLFFSNSQSFDPQDILRRTNNQAFKGFRFGFNINRIFWFKGAKRGK
ncbi:MAG TPA: DUF5777 family beta-barrel protein [Balneolales bacterium]|nr:DUF5777 family beta-barrel protein [Balneolales bacterium]